MRIPLLHPAPSPEDALGWLSACHTRMMHFLSVLERLPAHLADHGLDADARDAIAAVHRYFSEAAPLHHADEDEDVYPALLACAVQHGDASLPVRLQQIQQAHPHLEARWQALSAHLTAILAGAPVQEEPIQAFIAASRAHLHEEEADILPVARVWLDAETRRRLAHTMARRRQEQTP